MGGILGIHVVADKLRIALSREMLVQLQARASILGLTTSECAGKLLEAIVEYDLVDEVLGNTEQEDDHKQPNLCGND